MNPQDAMRDAPDARDASAALDLHPARTFLGQWLRDPVKMASVTPSGQQLAQLMVRQLPPGAQRVVELGAGTGVFTRALLDAGISVARLLVVEINPHLAEFLRNRFPGVTVACADACNLESLAREHGLVAGDGKVDAVISGLGLLLMRSETRCDIVRAACATLGKHGRFIQFTFGPMSPIRRQECDALNLSVHRAGLALRNLPPAAVYVYRPRHAPGDAANGAGGTCR